MVIIKATRLQAWAPAGGGKSMPSPPYLENKKKYFGYIGGLFATFFSFLGSFSPCGGLYATFYFMVGAFFWLAPSTKILIKSCLIKHSKTINFYL